MQQTARVLAALKRQLRTRGITYAKLAASLAISVPTVKRMFAGGDVTLRRLEAACDAAGIDVAELISATRAEALPDRLTAAQEDALAANPRLLSLFHLLRKLVSILPVDPWKYGGDVHPYQKKSFLPYLLISLLPQSLLSIFVCQAPRNITPGFVRQIRPAPDD